MSLYLGDKLISGIGRDRIADTLPIGAIIEWDSDLIPENWLLLNGQAVSRTVYSELFAIYGTTYGAGDGSTTFNLPDRRTRVAVGRDANDEDFAALGVTGGEKEHTLSIDELAKHKHLIYQDAHGNGVKFAVVTSYGATGGSTIQAAAAGGVSNLSPNSGDNAAGLVNAEYSGGSHPHNNLQPYIVTNFIVKAKLYTTEFIGGNMVIDNLTSDSSVNVLSARMGKELDKSKLSIGENGLITEDMTIKPAHYIYFNDDTDGSKFNAKMGELLATMPNNSMKFITFTDYPADRSGAVYNGWLSKKDENYATVFGVCYSRETAKTIHKAKFNGEWYNWKLGVDEDTAIQMKLLWQNASVSSGFGTQTLTIDMSDYDLIAIQFVLDANGRQLHSFMTETSKPCFYELQGYTKHFSVYVDKIVFTDASQTTTLIPYKIYGIKGVN